MSGDGRRRAVENTSNASFVERTVGEFVEAPLAKLGGVQSQAAIEARAMREGASSEEPAMFEAGITFP